MTESEKLGDEYEILESEKFITLRSKNSKFAIFIWVGLFLFFLSNVIFPANNLSKTLNSPINSLIFLLNALMCIYWPFTIYRRLKRPSKLTITDNLVDISEPSGNVSYELSQGYRLVISDFVRTKYMRIYKGKIDLFKSDRWQKSILSFSSLNDPSSQLNSIVSKFGQWFPDNSGANFPDDRG